MKYQCNCRHSKAHNNFYFAINILISLSDRLKSEKKKQDTIGRSILKKYYDPYSLTQLHLAWITVCLLSVCFEINESH